MDLRREQSLGPKDHQEPLIYLSTIAIAIFPDYIVQYAK